MKQVLHKYRSQLLFLALFLAMGAVLVGLTRQREEVLEGTLVKDGVSTPVQVTTSVSNFDRLFSPLVLQVSGYFAQAKITVSASGQEDLSVIWFIPALVVGEDSNGPKMLYYSTDYYDRDANETRFGDLYALDRSMDSFLMLGEGLELRVGDPSPALLKKVEGFRGRGEYLQQPG